MIFDVIVRQGYNESGKQIITISRIHTISLDLYLRKVQNEGKYIISVRLLIPLFKKREQSRINEQEDIVDEAYMSDT